MMNKYIKVISLLLALTSTIFLSAANAASSKSTTDMLIDLAETDTVLIERLNELAINDEKLLSQLLTMAEADPIKVAKLLNLAESDPSMFWALANVYNAQAAQASCDSEPPKDNKRMGVTFGTISDGGGIIH